MAAAGQQLLVGGGPRGGDGGEDPATGREDLQVACAPSAHLPFNFPRPGEQEMGVSIHEPGRDQTAARIEPFEGVE